MTLLPEHDKQDPLTCVASLQVIKISSACPPQIHPGDVECVDAMCAAAAAAETGSSSLFSRLSSLEVTVRSGTHLALLKVVVAPAADLRSFALNSTVDLDEDVVRNVLQWNDFERCSSVPFLLSLRQIVPFK